jgi:hypothetical protein
MAGQTLLSNTDGLRDLRGPLISPTILGRVDEHIALQKLLENVQYAYVRHNLHEPVPSSCICHEDMRYIMLINHVPKFLRLCNTSFS